jgi:outer membrane protein TolC
VLPRTLCALALTAVTAAPASAAPGRTWTLDEIIAAAGRGPRAQAASELTREAKGARTEARGSRLPSLTMRGIVAPSPSIDCVDPACTETDPKDPTVALAGLFGRVELSLVQPLYTFGKLDAAAEASSHAIRAARSLEDATAAEVAIEAARAYFGLKLARETRLMLEDGEERLTRALARVNEQLAAGSPDVTLQDRYRLETLGAEVGIRLADARAGEAGAIAAIRVLTGDPVAEIDDRPLEAIEHRAASEAAVVDRARARRPEVRAAVAASLAAGELARLESARLWPDLVLLGSLTLARANGVDDAPSAFANDPYNTESAAAALGLRWSFDPFAQRGRVQQARARSRRAAHMVEAAGRQATYQAHRAYVELERTRDRLAVARKGERSAKAWLASALQSEAIGAVETKDLADAYLAFFTARGRTLEAINDWNLAVYQLRRALGEFTATSGV